MITFIPNVTKVSDTGASNSVGVCFIPPWNSVSKYIKMSNIEIIKVADKKEKFGQQKVFEKFQKVSDLGSISSSLDPITLILLIILPPLLRLPIP
jgi:hypothetical protein